jgi:hypothetical protein
MGGTFVWGSSGTAQPQKSRNQESSKKKPSKPPPKAKAENLTSEALKFKTAQKGLKKALLDYQHTPTMKADDPSLVNALALYNKEHQGYFTTKLKDGETYKPPEQKALPAKVTKNSEATKVAKKPAASKTEGTDADAEAKANSSDSSETSQSETSSKGGSNKRKSRKKQSSS